MNRKKLFCAVGFFTAFLLWTGAVSLLDLQPIGPQGSMVGLGELNRLVHQWTGVHLFFYELTDFLSLVPLLLAAGFGILGLIQWIQRKSIGKVDFDLLALGGFYSVVMGFFCFFEAVIVNYRPILIEGVLEASYPSSTTMLSLCVLLTVSIQGKRRIRRKRIGDWVSRFLLAFAIFMVVARLISGVHWFSDIIGGILLSASLVFAYGFLLDRK